MDMLGLFRQSLKPDRLEEVQAEQERLRVDVEFLRREVDQLRRLMMKPMRSSGENPSNYGD